MEAGELSAKESSEPIGGRRLRCETHDVLAMGLHVAKLLPDACCLPGLPAVHPSQLKGKGWLGCGLVGSLLAGERRESKRNDIMIPNHEQFIQAIGDKTKVAIRFYSLADSQVIDLVCAPMDYGPDAGIPDGVNRYSFWDYSSNNGSPTLSLLPDQVLDLRALGEVFDPAQIQARPPQWFISRNWGDDK